MKLAFLLALVAAMPAGAAAQSGRQAGAPSSQVAADRQAEAYQQFLLAHRHEDDNDVEAAIAAYRRAMSLDPAAAEIPAALADLFLRQNRATDAVAMAEAALKLVPGHREAHRVLGTIYASRAGDAQAGSRETQRENLARAIEHLTRAAERPESGGMVDANIRAMLARLHVMNASYDEAIPLLRELVRQEPGWQDGPTLLVEAYAAAGRTDEAILWLEEAAPFNPQLYATLADFYGRSRRWRDAAAAYELALRNSPRSFDLRVRYGSMLLNAGGDEEAVKARDALREALAMRATDERGLFLLSLAERRAGDYEAATATARRLIAQNPKNVRGYSSLAEALGEQREYQAVAEALEPAVARFRQAGGNDASGALSTLLPHLGFAYQQLGQYDRAIAAFEEARKTTPHDPSLTLYLIQTHLAAKNFDNAATEARSARSSRPNDVRLARLEAQALSRGGRAGDAIALLEDLWRRNTDDPQVHLALASLYADVDRGTQAVKVLQDAQTQFPGDSSITFELGAVLERQKRFSDAEVAFRQVIAREPEHAAALNYLGYMLAERGERLGESVELIKRALAVEPNNGSYLDSLGWAYFKDGKFEQAEEPLRRAAEQLPANSVVQDHYGDLLFRLGRFQEAIDAWNQALGGDGDSIDTADIDRKIRSARQKMPRR
jgi:tetratricopeptide (TPR) repeat protein